MYADLKNQFFSLKQIEVISILHYIVSITTGKHSPFQARAPSQESFYVLQDNRGPRPNTDTQRLCKSADSTEWKTGDGDMYTNTSLLSSTK